MFVAGAAALGRNCGSVAAGRCRGRVVERPGVPGGGDRVGVARRNTVKCRHRRAAVGLRPLFASVSGPRNTSNPTSGLSAVPDAGNGVADLHGPTSAAPTSTIRPSRRLRPLLLLSLITLLLAAAIAVRSPAVQFQYTALLQQLHDWVSAYGVTRVAVAMGVVHFVAIVLCFPGTILIEVMAGYTLGLTAGYVSMHLSKVAAALMCFALGRTVLAGWVKRQRQRFTRFDRLLAAVKREGAPMMLYMRLSPVPSFINNYLMSAVDVPLLPYALTTALGTMPALLPIVSAGVGARDVSAAALMSGSVSASGAPAWMHLLRRGSMAVGGVLLAVAIVRIFRSTVKNAVSEEALEAGEMREVSSITTSEPPISP
ncbi:hypothetical protein CDCA_CDCA17G4454 [Cyanidium caldarium]|uniref:VTT domain-containing protein n=1 Tax=Cyanidium caldarium TaxID=2771 RepID=A0AAV9J282_CYACA|nr:hypothetical protein CDCA_CDCA17G4454 [Cyanidium caldarium]